MIDQLELKSYELEKISIIPHYLVALLLDYFKADSIKIVSGEYELHNDTKEASILKVNELS